ncbi:MAG: PH domain-containing protein [Candidatus Andersenbacteria bacterium]|nr:PH domain-containing protein [Candidatus Andersenbacteria bacterium]
MNSPTAPLTPSSELGKDIEKRTFGAIKLHPTDKIYENLEKDEEIVLCLERHWSQLLRPAINALVMSALPIIIIIAYTILGFSYPTIPQIMVATWFWYCLIFYYSLSRIIEWRSDVYIITDERIIDFDTRAFFSEKVTDTDLDSIHEIHYETGGNLLSGSMNKGKIILKDVSGSEVIMNNIPHPADVALVLGELIEKIKDEALKTNTTSAEVPSV